VTKQWIVAYCRIEDVCVVLLLSLIGPYSLFLVRDGRVSTTRRIKKPCCSKASLGSVLSVPHSISGVSSKETGAIESAKVERERDE
jgi:hypothetical protein